MMTKIFTSLQCCFFVVRRDRLCIGDTTYPRHSLLLRTACNGDKAIRVKLRGAAPPELLRESERRRKELQRGASRSKAALRSSSAVSDSVSTTSMSAHGWYPERYRIYFCATVQDYPC